MKYLLNKKLCKAMIAVGLATGIFMVTGYASALDVTNSTSIEFEWEPEEEMELGPKEKPFEENEEEEQADEEESEEE